MTSNSIFAHASSESAQADFAAARHPGAVSTAGFQHAGERDVSGNASSEPAQADFVAQPVGAVSTAGHPRATWRLLQSDVAPMGRQLALSEALLAGLADNPTPSLRWYLTERSALVLGNGQKPDVANVAVLRDRNVTAYRRTSGGTAVLVDSDALSMEVALPHGHPLASTDVVRAYQWIGDVWARALQSLGITEARAIPTDEVRAIAPVPKDDVLRLACYGTLSPWEVVVGQRKVVGLCQVRRRAGVLYQVGVHLRWQPQRLAPLLAIPPDQQDELATRLQAGTAGLDELAGRPVTAEDVITAVETSLTTLLDIHLESGDWRPDERQSAARIERERFQPIG